MSQIIPNSLSIECFVMVVVICSLKLECVRSLCADSYFTSRAVLEP